MSNLRQIIELCRQTANKMDECRLTRKNEKTDFIEVYDIDTENLLTIFGSRVLNKILFRLSHYSSVNAQKLEKKFKRIYRWANNLDLSSPRPSQTQLPSKADYSDSVISNINYLGVELSRAANELRYAADLLTEASNGETNLPDYRALNLAERTITIGSKPHSITSEKVWDFIKDLCSAFRDNRIVPSVEGNVDNKNAVDELRRLIGKDNLHSFVVFVKKGGYKLNPEVKILMGGQIGIRKTHLKKTQATHERHTSDFSKNH